MNAFRQLSVDRFSEHEIEKYNSALDQFYLRHEQYLEDSYKIDELKSRSLTLDVEVANCGNLPAEDIRVLVKVLLWISATRIGSRTGRSLHHQRNHSLEDTPTLATSS